MRAFPELLVGKWRLRALVRGDAEAWLTIVREPELRRLSSWSIDTLEEMQRNVVAYVEGQKAQSTRRWAIVDAAGKFCGTCGFKDWDRDNHVAALTYELAHEHRHRGVMSAIATAVVSHGFSEMHLRVIRALVMVENTGSIRLLEKLGFKRTRALTSFRKCGSVLRDFYAYERLGGM